MTIDTQEQEVKLLAEKSKIEEELSRIAEKDGRGVWQAKQSETTELVADREVAAEALTEFEQNLIFVQDLKNQMEAVDEALSNITVGHYGFCVVCSAEIDQDRLGANPSAKTCRTHMNI